VSSWRIQDGKIDFTIQRTIAAPRDVVYRVLADLEAYPEFISDLVSVTRHGDRFTLVARAAILTIPVTVSARFNPGQAIEFDLVEGPVSALQGAWRVRDGASPGLSEITLEIHAEAPAQGEWLLRMSGKYVESKTEKLVAAFSRRVAAMQSVPAVPTAAPGWRARLLAWVRQAWEQVRAPRAAARIVAPPKHPPMFTSEHQQRTLEALATTLIPPDDFDPGVQGMGFVGVAEVRARYEAGRGQLYLTALPAVDQMAQALFAQASFVALEPDQRQALLDAVRRNEADPGPWGAVKPAAFFEALWEDVVFLYCTHPDTWRHIGWPGPAFEAGGYAEANQVQTFMGKGHER
jgi:ribosome-associated toxin RatA of RatAB toxin-antitoxin module